MNLEIRTYNIIVNEIANGFFNEAGVFQPAVGKANMVAVYANHIKQDERLIDDTISVLDYVDEFVKNRKDLKDFMNALKDTDLFSFGAAVESAMEIVDIRKGQLIRKSKMDDLLTAIIEKVNKFDENISPDEFKNILDKIKNSEAIDNKAIVEEYWKKKDLEKGA